MKILLFRGRGFISACIRFLTWSRWSHVAVQLDDGSYIESWPRSGVHRFTRLAHYGVDVDEFDVALTPSQEHVIEMYLKLQLGKGYDYYGVLRFLPRSRTRFQHSTRWFCSDLIAAAFEFAAVPLLRNTPWFKVSPAMIGTSLRLLPVGETITVTRK